MSEKTENRLATFLAIIIAVFMAVSLNAQVQYGNKDDYTMQNGVAIYDTPIKLTGNNLGNLPKKCVFKKEVLIQNNQSTNVSAVCLYFMSEVLVRGGGSKVPTFDAGSTIYLALDELSSSMQLVNYNTMNGSVVLFGQSEPPSCLGDVSLPVEAIEFYYQDRGNGTGSFKLVVTDEYDIDKYRIVITDQDGIDIGYKWWYASEGTPEGLYRVYEIPVKLPTDCADIDFMYARVYKMEASTMEYEQVLNTISILNQ